MSDLSTPPVFDPTNGMTPEESAILNGIPVGGAHVAEPLTPEEATAFVQHAEPVGPDDKAPAQNVATTPDDNTVYPGDFTEQDRAMLKMLYNRHVEFGPAMDKIIEFARALTPEVVEDAKKKLGNPLAQRLIKSFIPGS